MSAGANGHVTRTYRSIEGYLANTNNFALDGRAWSVLCNYSSDTKVNNLSIQCGSPDSKVNMISQFPEFNPEFTWFGNVFRYVRMDGIKLCVVRMPQATLDARADIVATSANVDPGCMYLTRWAGQPAIATYDAGIITTRVPDDLERMRHKVAFPVTSKRGTADISSIVVQPMTIEQVYTQDFDNVEDLPVFKYVPTPEVDIYHWRMGLQDLSSFGGLMVWHHPDITTMPNSTFRMHFWFEIQFTWHTIRQPQAVPTALPVWQPIELMAPPAEKDPDAPDGVNTYVKQRAEAKELSTDGVLVAQASRMQL